MLGVTTATEWVPPPPLPEPLDDPLVDCEAPEPLLAEPRDADRLVLARVPDADASVACTELAGWLSAGAERVETSVAVPELPLAPDPLSARVRTGALNRSAHILVSIRPEVPRPCRDWKSSTAARVSGP